MGRGDLARACKFTDALDEIKSVDEDEGEWVEEYLFVIGIHPPPLFPRPFIIFFFLPVYRRTILYWNSMCPSILSVLGFFVALQPHSITDLADSSTEHFV